MLASDINLTPVRGENKRDIDVRSMCANLLNGGTAPSDPYEFNGSIANAVTGRCLKFDMDVEADRAKYADLVSVSTTHGGDKVHIVWEDHIKTPSGGLIIYVCLIEVNKVASKFIESM